MKMRNCLLLLTIFITIIDGKSSERLVVPRDQPFFFDCQQDDSVFYAQRLGDWSELTDESDTTQYLNIKLNYLTKEKVFRVNVDAAQSEHVGYYGCRKATWTSTDMSQVYQVILADVQSFYWTYVCHGLSGSCSRNDDANDETRSSFEVADETRVDFFCCASVSGFDNVDMKMNSVGEHRGKVEVKRNEELDGTRVICANQHTSFKRKSSSRREQQNLNCELIVDQRPFSTLTSSIVITDPMPFDPSFVDTVPSTGTDSDNDYFNQGQRRPGNTGIRKKLSMGKLLAIIFGSIAGAGAVLLILCILIFCLCRKEKSHKSPPPQSNQYLPVLTSAPSRKDQDQNPHDAEPIYVEPTPHYENAPVFLRL